MHTECQTGLLFANQFSHPATKLKRKKLCYTSTKVEHSLNEEASEADHDQDLDQDLAALFDLFELVRFVIV